jgi:hypothetical protein
MLRPDMLLALSLTGTFVDTLLRTDFAVRRHPSYTGAWPLPWPDFHRLEDTCFLGTPYSKKARPERDELRSRYHPHSAGAVRFNKRMAPGGTSPQTAVCASG